MCSIDVDPVGVLADAVEQLAATPAVDRGATGCGDRISRLLTVQAQLDAVLLDEVAVFDTLGGYTLDGCASTGAWLRTINRIGRRDAAALVKQARQLQDLPAATAALRQGRISRQHATRIIAARTRSRLDAAEFGTGRGYEQILVDLATDTSPDEVQQAADRLVEAEAPDRDQQLLDALADRRCDLYPVGDLVKVDAMIDKATAEALTLALDALSQPTAGDERTWLVRRADAFTHLILAGIDQTELPQHGRSHPQVQLTMTLDQLSGLSGTGPLLARFGRIPSATAQRLSCDAVLTRVICDPAGQVVDVGRSHRYTTTAQNKAIDVMYDQCAYPNCGVPVRSCEIHHIHWWSRGGPTDLDNLLPLCKQRHIFVHEHGYTIRAATDDDYQALQGPQLGAKTNPSNAARGPDPGGGRLPRPCPRNEWTFVSPRGTPIPDHRTTLHRYLQPLTLQFDDDDNPDPDLGPAPTSDSTLIPDPEPALDP